MQKITIDVETLLNVMRNSYINEDVPNSTQFNLGASSVIIEVKRYLRDIGAQISNED